MFSNLPKLSRDRKVELAYAGFFTAAALTTVATGGLAAPVLLAAEMIGVGAGCTLGSEATKSVLNWFNAKKENKTAEA